MILKEVDRIRRQPPRTGTARLDEVRLGSGLQRLLDAALAENHGSPEWRRRKQTEARELLALTCLAPRRMIVLHLDLSESLRAVIHLRAPVPTKPPGSDTVVVERGAVLGLQYCREALLLPQPGASFVQILEPQAVYLAQVPAVPPYCLCLAPTLPPGVPCKELILMSHAALTLQSFQIDAGDAAGVFNADAARWWQDNAQRIPLTREPLLET